MLILRLSKTACVFAIALFATIVIHDNILFPSTNLAFVHHVFSMDTVPAEAPIHYRAIQNPVFHVVGYIGIVTCEALTAALCWIGAFMMLRKIRAPKREFIRSKRFAIAGLSLGFLIWQVAFMSIGGEWFGMWQSPTWNGVPDAFRFFITILCVLIYLISSDLDPEDI